MKLFLTLFLLFLGVNLANAQILNFEKYRKPGEIEKNNVLIGDLSVDFSLNNRSINSEGEADLYVGTKIASDLGYFIQQHAFYAFGDLVYSAVGEQSITSAGFIHLRSNLWRKRVLSYEIFTQAQFDESRGMEQRFLGGSGIRLKLADSDQTKVAFGTGLMYESEKWDAVEKNMLKSTNYISLAHRFNEKVNFSTIAYYQTGYDNEINNFRNRFSGEFIIKAKVFTKFSYTTSFFIFYEDKPVLPVNKLVFTLTNGFTWSF